MNQTTHFCAVKIYSLLVCCTLLTSQPAFAQSTDSTKNQSRHIGGGVTVTNNGISLLPTFSLGKPAAIFDLNVGGKRLSFEPQFRFSLEGKPWSYIFWWRYKLVNSSKFEFRAGAHQAVIFKETIVPSSGSSSDMLEAQRYIAAEFVPNYFITERISVGLYYLTSHGLDASTINQTHFLTINGNFSNIKLYEKYYMKFNPQLYYLKMDEKDGYYATATITLAKHDFPLSIQSITNQAIETNIPAKSDFVWNVSLIYSFSNEYAKK